uniref:Iron-sulfur cluster assembly 2 homolog, mitochondrial n=1 Tax=Strigamia maritima TaxID=126957 RepID=T1JGQ9_STRMM
MAASMLMRRIFLYRHLARRYSSSSNVEIELSERCIRRLRDIISEKEKYLRIVVDGGGCSGFQYVFSLDDKVNADDCIVKKDGVGVVIDKMSLQFMQGATVDYSEELIRSSFRVLNNPKAEKGCSCGASFNVKGL